MERESANTIRRKDEHLDLCARAPVEHAGSGLLEEVGIVHEALPERRLEDVDLSCSILGRNLRAPVFVSAMTGGTLRAGGVNRALAAMASRHGFGMGLGSQRAMLEQPELAPTFRVRDVAPDLLLLANIGMVQARDAGPDRVRHLVESVDADALCVHLNPAQELVQAEGDRDFRGCLDGIGRLVSELPVPVVVKETGCGLGPRTLARLADVGVEWVDVAGVGGTSWPGVESFRGSESQRRAGRSLAQWGIPTAASILYARRAGLRAIASGGIRSGLDAARALALGAEAVALALPFLRALEEGGTDALDALAADLTETLRRVALLTGGDSVEHLRTAPHVIGPNLRAWAESVSSHDLERAGDRELLPAPRRSTAC